MMKKKIVLMLVAVSLMAGSAMAAFVPDASFDDWDVSGGPGYAYSNGTSSPWISANYSAIMNGPDINASWGATMQATGYTGDQYLGHLNSYGISMLTLSLARNMS